jgi:hypothetical protein
VTDPRFRTEHDSMGEVAVPARPTQGVPQMPSPRADALQRTSAGAGCIQAPVECTLAPASCCWAAALSASTSASSCADPRCSMGREPRRDDHTTRPPPTPSSRCAHTPPPHPTSPDLVRTFRPDAEQNPRSATPQSRQHRKRVPSQEFGADLLIRTLRRAACKAHRGRPRGPGSGARSPHGVQFRGASCVLWRLGSGVVRGRGAHAGAARIRWW